MRGVIRIFGASRTIKIYLVLIEIDDSPKYGILVVSPNPTSSVVGLYRTLHIPGQGNCTCISYTRDHVYSTILVALFSNH